ncbi:MAG TPA: dihydrolipoyl dehydrogenase [bacterium]|nr:dihydrolipoyl dehydrogenase [bacterium]
MYDLVVIGSGPGGHEAAAKAGELGKKVAIIEKGEWGGTCTNIGCIPTKALLEGSKRFSDLTALKRFGISVSEPHIDFAQLKKHQAQAVRVAQLGVKKLLGDAHVDMIQGTGEISAPGKVVIDAHGEKSTLESENILIAWGSSVFIPLGFSVSEHVITSDEFLALESLPQNVVIIGGGVIGCEFATLLVELGSKVTIIELLDKILPYEDREAAAYVQQELSKHGVQFHLSTKVDSLTESATGVHVVTSGAEQLELDADIALMCIGRKPALHTAELDRLGIAYERGITVDERMATNVPGMYALGDATGGILLAHRASYQARVFIDQLFGQGKLVYDEQAIPSVAYTHPTIASVGVRAVDANSQGEALSVRQYDYGANALARIKLAGTGFVKVILSGEQVVGATVVGYAAEELIASLGLAVANRMTCHDLEKWVIAHPTLSEVLWK